MMLRVGACLPLVFLGGCRSLGDFLLCGEPPLCVLPPANQSPPLGMLPDFLLLPNLTPIILLHGEIGGEIKSTWLPP